MMESCLKALAIISLLCVGIKAVSSQCYTDQDDYSCSGTNVGSGSRDDCCLGAGFSFQGIGQPCQSCIVVGWVNDTLRAPESQNDYSPMVTYTKLPPGTTVLTVVFTPELILDGDARAPDVKASTAAIRIGNFEPTTTTNVNFVVDSIGMEPDETATLRLNIFGGSLLEGAIFDSDLQLVIEDDDKVEITFGAREYAADESSAIKFQVFKSKTIAIATPIEMLIKSLSFSEYLAMPASERPVTEGIEMPQAERIIGGVVEVHSPIEAAPEKDYDPAPVIVRFEADEGRTLVREQRGLVQLVDDNIDEADQYFIITLDVVKALNNGLIDDSGTRASLARILDNDVLRIGFERNNYTVDEPAGEIFFNQITLRKNIVTEQTYLIALATSSEGSSPATGGLIPIPSGSDKDIRDYHSFHPWFVTPIFPEEDSKSIGVSLFGDLSPEGEEHFKITASPSDREGPQYAVPSPDAPFFCTTVITIRDQDKLVLAWEKDVTLVEGETVSDQACYTVIPPDLELPEDFSLFVYVDTVDITATAPGDYDTIRSSKLEQERLITNDNKRACVTVNANTDNTHEVDEVYQLNIVPDLFADTSNVVVQNTAQVTIKDVPLGSQDNPAASCASITGPPGYYWVIHHRRSSPAQVFCNNEISCGGASDGWTRIAHLDMTNTSHNCPPGFRLYNQGGVRACGRQTSSTSSCTSVTFPANGLRYSRVYGRVRGYQFGSPESFSTSGALDSYYLDGVSLTYGSPRKHIWSFAGERTQSRARISRCLCSESTGPLGFVGNNYFCAAAPKKKHERILYTDNPLWDGQGCIDGNSCCLFSGPPYFCRQLPASTSEDVELRVCGDRKPSNEDTPVDIIELYVS